MDLMAAGIIALSIIGCGCLACCAYVITEDRKQKGITERATLKSEASTVHQGRREWYEPVLEKLLENPEIQKMIIEFGMNYIQNKNKKVF